MKIGKDVISALNKNVTFNCMKSLYVIIFLIFSKIMLQSTNLYTIYINN